MNFQHFLTKRAGKDKRRSTEMMSSEGMPQFWRRIGGSSWIDSPLEVMVLSSQARYGAASGSADARCSTLQWFDNMVIAHETRMWPRSMANGLICMSCFLFFRGVIYGGAYTGTLPVPGRLRVARVLGPTRTRGGGGGLCRRDGAWEKQQVGRARG
jgi:hypothetical protein